jgi:6-phosphofructokinase 1
MLDPVTGRARVRQVDIHTERYAIARRYMLRLRRDDFEADERLEPLAAVVRLPLDEFRRQFEYLVADEPPALKLTEAGRVD